MQSPGGSAFSKFQWQNALRIFGVAYTRKYSSRLAHARARVDRYDAISSETARPQLAPAGGNARSGRVWRNRHLQRYLHARRSSGGGLLAQTGKLGRSRIFRVYDREFGQLSLDPLGRVADVLGRDRFFGPD